MGCHFFISKIFIYNPKFVFQEVDFAWQRGKAARSKSKEVEIQLNRVLHSILKKSNRIILTLVKSNLHQNQNISLMTAICGIRIIFGRYLALYRWNLLHQSKSISVENFATQEVFQKMLYLLLITLDRFLNLINKKLKKYTIKIFFHQTQKNYSQNF